MAPARDFSNFLISATATTQIAPHDGRFDWPHRHLESAYGSACAVDHMIIDYAITFVLTLLAGAWSIPAGILFGLDPMGVYVVATIGGLAFAVVFLAIGQRAHDALFERVMPGAADRVSSSRAGEIVQRWGAPGLAIVGGLVLGPTITLLAALVLPVDIKRFAMWYAGSTIIGFGLLTAFWAAVL